MRRRICPNRRRVKWLSANCWVSSRLTSVPRSVLAVGSTARSRGERRPDARELLGGRAPLEREGEAFVVIPSLPRPKGRGRLVEVHKAMASPELFLVDAMAAFHLAVLLRTPRPDEAMPDPRGLDREHEVEWELPAVVALQFADPEGQRPLELAQERHAGALVQPPVETQNPKAGAVVQGGVLERSAARDFHELNVHLDAFARLRLLEELQLPGQPLPRPPQVRKTQIPKNALDRAHRDSHIVPAPQSELRARRAVAMLPAGLPDQLDDPGAHPAPPATGIPRDEALEAPLSPPHPPAPNRPHRHPNRCAPAVGPWSRAQSSTISRCLTRRRYCSRTFTALRIRRRSVGP